MVSGNPIADLCGSTSEDFDYKEEGGKKTQ